MDSLASFIVAVIAVVTVLATTFIYTSVIRDLKHRKKGK